MKSRYLTKYHAMKNYGGTGDIAPLILNFVIIWK